ncbi:C40 family peptidase [Modestobacter sp. L9-4]|uniref:C40 family peptidase n=1 Tax=Modestobacter sp. L9-4 TaxID=2851567 RepID=UPI002104A3E7|nr:C40 family peptidase [Modestobacter sp. L9-4]
MPTGSTTGRRPAGRRGSRLAASGLLAGVAASLTLALLPASAAAAPAEPVTQATSPEEATRLVADADHQLEVVAEGLNDARETLAQQQAAADAAGRTVADTQAQLAALDEQMRRIARGAFTGENLSRFNALMTSGSADEFLSQVTTLDAIAGHTDQVITQVSAAATAAQQARAAAEAAAATAQQTLADATARQEELTARAADYRQQFAALSAAQQQEVLVERAGPVLEPPARVAAVVAAAPTAAAGPAQTASADAQTAPSGSAQAASTDAVQTALDTAMAQLGDPYVWSAAGPDAFDCSGLTQYAYAAAGIALPHSSRAQSTMGTPVDRSALQPGDLVFFYSPVSHVGMYIGNGQMVHASTSGRPVIVSSVDMKGYVGARRLVG